MKNLISFITLTLCIMVSAVNAQNTTTGANTSKSLSQGFHKVVASVIEDVNTEDEALRNMAMLLEEVSPEAGVETNVAGNYIAGEKGTEKY